MPLLTDMNIRQELREALTKYFTINDDSNVSPSVVWDSSKAMKRGKIISIGSRIAATVQPCLQHEDESKK